MEIMKRKILFVGGLLLFTAISYGQNKPASKPNDIPTEEKLSPSPPTPPAQIPLSQLASEPEVKE